jgi:glycosyltransferase involved in cell wall biosynthesis
MMQAGSGYRGSTGGGGKGRGLDDFPGRPDAAAVRAHAARPSAPAPGAAMSRLILVVAAFFPDSYGGAERQALILAEALGRRGVDVTLVAPTVCPRSPAVEPTAFGRIERFRVKAYPNNGGRHFGSFLAWTLWFRRRYGSAGYAGVPIYVFHARLHALGPALAAIDSGAPLVIKLGGGGEASDFAALRAKKFAYGRWVQSLLLRRVNVFVANGAQIEADLAALGVRSERIAAFPNGVVLPPDAEIADALTRRRGDRFISSGRMLPDKRVAVLHDAAMALAAEGRRPRMVFLGEGPERQRLASRPLPPAARDLFAFPGFVADVYPELLEADFFVSASMREGQSNALLEAMSAGVIPIVYAASGAADAVGHGKTGFIVRQSEPAAFAEAMRAALDLPDERRREMALAAGDFAKRNIGIDAVADRTIALFASLAPERKAAA